MSTNTTSLRLIKQAHEEYPGTWGDNLNAALDVVDQAVAGWTLINTVGGTTTLADADNTADASKSMVLYIYGVLASDALVVVPQRYKIYAVVNATTGAHNVTLNTATGTGIVIPQGANCFITVDATNNVLDFLTPATVSGSGILPVNEGGTGSNTATGALVNLNAANQQLSNISATSLSADLVPSADNVRSLGSTIKGFTHAYLSSGATIDFGQGNYTATHAAGLLTLSGQLKVGGTAASGYTLSVQQPGGATWIEILNSGGTNQGAFFGITGNSFQQYNWQGGDIEFYTNTSVSAGTLRLTITNSGDTQFTGNAAPSSNGGFSLGTSTLGWANLKLATGATINVANGDWIATHSAGILTVGTGDLRVTTAGSNAASVVTVGGTQTLTNKTLTSPTITTPTLTVKDASFTVQDDLDTSKQLQFQLSGITTATTRTLTVPDANDTIAVLALAQAFTNKSYNGLTLTSTTGTFTLTNAKTLTVQNTLTFAGTDGKTLTTNASLTLAGADGKTLTVSNSGTLQGGDAWVLSIAASKTVTHSNTVTFNGVDSKTLTINNSGTLGGADGWTLAIAANKTLTVSNTLTFTGTDSTSFAFPSASDTVGCLGTAQTWTKQNIFNEATTVASSAGAALDDVKVSAATTTITGVTTITRLAKVGLYQPTLTNGSAVTVTDAATLYIDNAPVGSGAGPVTITNAWAFLVGAGSTKLQATTINAALTYGGVTLTNAVTGTGKMVLDTSPTLATPVLGVATATTINKVTLTQPATGSTLTIADGKTLTSNASITLAGTDGKSLTLTNSLTVTTNDGTLAFSAAGKTLTVNQSLTLDGTSGKSLVLTNGLTVSGNDGTLSFGAASKTLSVNNTITLAAGADSQTFTFPSASGTVACLNAAETFTAKQTISLAGLGLEVINTTNAAANNTLKLTSHRGTGATSDNNNVQFWLDNAAGTSRQFATIKSAIATATDTSEDGNFIISLIAAGAVTDQLILSKTALYPNASGGLNLGVTSTNPWGNAYFKSGGVLDWNNGNVTLTHSAGLLTLAGGATINGTSTLSQQVVFSGVLSPAQITASQNDYNPANLATASLLRLDSNGAWNITGLAGGTAGRIFVLHYVGANSITLTSEDTGSTAANRFSLTKNVSLTANTTIVIQYDGTSSRWRAVGGSGGGATFSYQTTAPAGPGAGDIWIDSSTGIEYQYVNDGNTSQWVEFNNASAVTPQASGVTYSASATVLSTDVQTAIKEVNNGYFYRLDSDFVGTNVNTAQPMFNVGVTLAASTVYEFEIFFFMTRSAGTTSHTVAFGFAAGGGLTLNNINYYYNHDFIGAIPTGSNANNNTQGAVSTNSATVLTAATTSATVTLVGILKGTLSVGTGGTFTPQYTLSAAPGGAYSFKQGSYIRLRALGASGANSSFGTWA